MLSKKLNKAKKDKDSKQQRKINKNHAGTCKNVFCCFYYNLLSVSRSEKGRRREKNKQKERKRRKIEKKAENKRWKLYFLKSIKELQKIKIIN